MAESVILQLPPALLLYGAALFFCLFERRLSLIHISEPTRR